MRESASGGFVLFGESRGIVGVFSDIHDHEGAECVFRVVRGVGVERRYTLATTGWRG